MIGAPGLAKGNIFLTCQTITSDLIFTNGLNQNIIILYKLFTIIGYTPYLLVNGQINVDKLPSNFNDIRWITIEKYLQKPFNVDVLLEIGVNMAEKVRNLFHMMGARVMKLYLGNSLNIDTEMSIFSPKMEIIQHKIGDIDNIFTSPHYADQLDYLCKLNNIPTSSGYIAPYVWDPMFITETGGEVAVAETQSKTTWSDILIFEPNISFQKCCVIPLLICEKYYMEHKEYNNKIHVFNTTNYDEKSNFFMNLLNGLQLWKDGKIVLHERHSVKEIMAQNPGSVILCHQTNNEYNYMYLEAFYKGFTLVHNAESWKHGGIFYKENDIQSGVDALTVAFTSKAQNKEAEKNIIWNHSIHNTANQEGWLRLLSCRT